MDIHVKFPPLLSDINQTWNSLISFAKKKIRNMEFRKNPTSGKRVVACKRTDGETLILTFSNWFTNAPKVDAKEIVWEVVGSIRVVQDRGSRRVIVQTVRDLQVQWNVGKFLVSVGTTWDDDPSRFRSLNGSVGSKPYSWWRRRRWWWWW